MRRDILLLDAGIAAIVAILVLVLTPGLAVAGILAIVALVVVGVTLAVGLRRRRPRPPKHINARRR